MQPQRVASGQNESWQVCVLCMVSAMPAIVKICLLLALMLPAAAQRFASFDAATAPSVYILVAGVVSMRPAVALSNFKLLRHPGPTLQPRSLRGIGAARGTTSRARPCPGLALSHHGDSYLASLCDGAMLQERSRYSLAQTVATFRRASAGASYRDRSPASKTVFFPEPLASKAFKVLMRGAKPWAVQCSCDVGASAYMLVSGTPAAQEQCLVAAGVVWMQSPASIPLWLAQVLRYSPAVRKGSCRCWAEVAWELWPARCPWSNAKKGKEVSQPGPASQARQHLLGRRLQPLTATNFFRWQFQSMTLRLCLRCRRWARCCVPAWKGSEVWWGPCSVSLQGRFRTPSSLLLPRYSPARF